MGNGYNHHLRHQNLQQRGTFLPMLCSRTWIKDVHLPRWQRRSASSGEPSSPRVSCMGQVKRHNNRVTAYSTPHTRLTTTTTTTTTTKTNHNNLKYSSNKPQNLIPSKNHITTTSTTGSARRANFNDHYNHNYVPVNIVDMDPPLPVIKRVQQPSQGGDEASLWKRRSGGMALKSLQIHSTTHSIIRDSI